MKKTILLLLTIIITTHCSEARQPNRGYRGFFEWSSSLRSEKFGYLDIYDNPVIHRENTFYTGFSTSHGYQINPMFFVGAGLDIEKCTTFEKWVVPVFFQGRIDLQFGKFTPYGDLRLGANIADGVGIYISPTIGYRFNWGRKTGVNVGAGLSLAGYKTEHYEGIFTGPDSLEIYYVGTKHHIRPYFSFRLGLDF